MAKPNEKISTCEAQHRFIAWVIHNRNRTREEEGSKMGPWPQCELEPSRASTLLIDKLTISVDMVRNDGKRDIYITCIHTRIVRRDPETKKATLTESDLDRSSRDRLIAITDGAFQPERMHFFCCKDGYLRFPMSDNGECFI